MQCRKPQKTPNFWKKVERFSSKLGCFLQIVGHFFGLIGSERPKRTPKPRRTRRCAGFNAPATPTGGAPVGAPQPKPPRR